MLNRQPAIIAVSSIRVNTEAELLDIEIECLILISHVQPDNPDTPAHRTSSSFAVLLTGISRCRFSETAILRSGRCAAIKWHGGTGSN